MALGEAVELALETDEVVVGVRPVTDTVKVDLGGRLGETIDRSTLREVTSPLVLPARAVAALTEMPTGDLTSVLAVVSSFGVRELEAPPLSRRIRATEDLPVLEALGRPSGLEQELLGHR